MLFEAIGLLVTGKSNRKKRAKPTGTATSAPTKPREERDRRQTFSKAFRYHVPAGHSPQPTSVGVVGSFTDWKPVPLVYDKALKTWYITLYDILGNRTHHYVILVDGTPTYDKTCDGLAIPQGSLEERWQIETPKGPRVMMLFGQTK